MASCKIHTLVDEIVIYNMQTLTLTNSLTQAKLTATRVIFIIHNNIFCVAIKTRELEFDDRVVGFNTAKSHMDAINMHTI